MFHSLYTVHGAISMACTNLFSNPNWLLLVASLSRKKKTWICDQVFFIFKKKYSVMIKGLGFEFKSGHVFFIKIWNSQGFTRLSEPINYTFQKKFPQIWKKKKSSSSSNIDFVLRIMNSLFSFFLTMLIHGMLPFLIFQQQVSLVHIANTSPDRNSYHWN
jgi:hypothetical protein